MNDSSHDPSGDGDDLPPTGPPHSHAPTNGVLRDPFGPVPFGHEEVLRGRSKKAVRDGGLVLQSAGIPFALQAGGAGARLVVSALDAERAREELGDYLTENREWPPPKPAAPRISSNGLTGAFLFAVVVAVMHWMQHRFGYGIDWTSAGRMEGGAVAHGDWWRTFTALTLHVDLQHLVSNIVFGGLFGALAAQAMGPGVAWLGTVLAGAGGNALESYLVDPTHRAIGASTAIFGTLGLMTAAEWSRRGRTHSPWVRRVAPLFGGAVLFGWVGVGDGSGRVDVLAHATGFAAGCLLGLVVGKLRLDERVGPRLQIAAGAVTLALLVLGWAAALA